MLPCEMINKEEGFQYTSLSWRETPLAGAVDRAIRMDIIRLKIDVLRSLM